jgi:hypothetical protein
VLFAVAFDAQHLGLLEGLRECPISMAQSMLDLQDLRDGLRLGSPVQELAEFLMRDVNEVRAKIAEIIVAVSESA